MNRDLKHLEPVMHLFKDKDEYRIWLGQQGDAGLPYVTFYIEKNEEKHVVGCGQVEYDDNKNPNLVAAIEDSFLDFYGINLGIRELLPLSKFLTERVMQYYTIKNIVESE